MENTQESKTFKKVKLNIDEVDIEPEILTCFKIFEESSSSVKQSHIDRSTTFKSFEDTERCYLVTGGFPRDLVSALPPILPLITLF